MRHSSLVVVGAVVLVGTAGAHLAAPSHHGPASPSPLYYSGFVTQGGQPVSAAAMNLDVLLFAAEAGGTALCDSVPGDVPVTAGHFTIRLADSCEAALAAAPRTWIEIRIDGTPVGTRVESGAVPFAFRATHAETATSVPALEARLALIENGAAFCGQTSASVGNLGGYGAMRAACQTACGTSTAWACTSQDFVKALQHGAMPPVPVDSAYWVVGADLTYVNSTTANDDCDGYTNGSGTGLGSAFRWTGSHWSPAQSTCSNARPLACCDWAP